MGRLMINNYRLFRDKPIWSYLFFIVLLCCPCSVHPNILLVPALWLVADTLAVISAQIGTRFTNFRHLDSSARACDSGDTESLIHDTCWFWYILIVHTVIPPPKSQLGSLCMRLVSHLQSSGVKLVCSYDLEGSITLSNGKQFSSMSCNHLSPTW